MEFYNEPVRGTYRTDRRSWFEMPLEDGSSTTVIAVSKDESIYWIIAYTILIGSIFMAVSRLTSSLVLTYFQLDDLGDRNVMLVSFFNSDSPYTVLSAMCGFAYRALVHCRRRLENYIPIGNETPPKRWAVNWNTLLGALILATIAGSNIIANTVTKFIVTKEIIVRTAARANPDTMFYPGQVPFAQRQIARSPAGLQALGRIESVREKLAELITIEAVNGTSQNGSTLELSYSYNISGSDMGLQLAPFLVYAVSGHCRTEYRWLNISNPNIDIYTLWDSVNMTDTAAVDSDWNAPPFLNVPYRPGEVRRSLITHGYEFALVPNTQGRKSDMPNIADPWYLTEDNPLYVPRVDERNVSSSRYQVKRGRPPMLCWQNDTWSLGSNKVYNVQNLTDLTSKGLRLSTFLRDKLFQVEFASPPMVQLANNLGFSWMDAAKYTRVNTKRISAEMCNTTKEIERLVYLSYLSSREVVRNTVLVYSFLLNQTDIPNAAAVNGKVPYEYADFILESQDVAALSVIKLLIIPSVAALLWLIVWLRACLHDSNNKLSNHSRYQLRSIAFQSTQLYRLLDEQISKKRRWSGRTGVPFIRDLDSDTENEAEAKHLPISVGGPGKQIPTEFDKSSNYIQPKIIRVPELECNHEQKRTFLRKLMFWKHHHCQLYELVMTTRWKDDLKPPTKTEDNTDVNIDTQTDIKTDINEIKTDIKIDIKADTNNATRPQDKTTIKIAELRDNAS
jgi:hypothetical protein